MKLRFAVKDREYMKAVVEALARADQNVYAEIGRELRIGEDSLLVTDISPERFQELCKRRSLAGVVFFSENGSEAAMRDDQPWTVCKYARISEILAELRYYYYLWTGKSEDRPGDANVVSVQSDAGGCISGIFSRMLASQYLYRVGGRVLIIPLTSLDRSEIHHDERHDSFAKFMYLISLGKSFPQDPFFYKDSLGVSYLRTGHGINPVFTLGADELRQLIDHVSTKGFDLVILDAGDEFSSRNLEVIRRSGRKFWLHDSDGADVRSSALYRDIFGDDMNVQMVTLAIRKDKLSLTADDYIRGMYADGAEARRTVNERSRTSLFS